jgi:hypothetical protein
MKPYHVTIEVTTTYTVKVHARSAAGAGERAWRLDVDEVEAQGSAESTKTTYVDTENIEEIQRESEEDE